MSVDSKVKEALAALTVAELEKEAPHLVHEIKASAVEAYVAEYSIDESKVNKDKSNLEDSTKLIEIQKDRDALKMKITELEKKAQDEELKKEIDIEVAKFSSKFQPLARTLIEAHIKAQGEVTNQKKVLEEAVKATEKNFEDSKLGEIKAAPVTGVEGKGEGGYQPFAHAGLKFNESEGA